MLSEYHDNHNVNGALTPPRYADAKKNGADTSALEVERRGTENDRDRDRRIFSKIIHTKMSVYIMIYYFCQ